MAKFGDTNGDAMIDFEEFKVLANDTEGMLKDVDWLDLATKMAEEHAWSMVSHPHTNSLCTIFAIRAIKISSFLNV